MRSPKILGFEIVIWTNFCGVKVMDTCLQYGNSPIQDKKSMDSLIRALQSNGYDFSVFAIIKGE